MKPYDNDFILKEINKYYNKINVMKSGNYSIIKGEYDFTNGYMYENMEKHKYNSLSLLKDDEIIMTISPEEIQGAYGIIKYAKGNVGVVGLGLGYTVQELAKRENIEKVTVYEISEDVINMYNRNFEHSDKIEVILCNAYYAERKEFDYFFVDTYDYELSLKVVDDYKKFNKIHKIKEYSFWGMEHFMLNCEYDDILWVYIPQLWIDMSRKYYSILDMTKYIDYYKILDQKLVKNILMEFKKVLNE